MPGTRRSAGACDDLDSEAVRVAEIGRVVAGSVGRAGTGWAVVAAAVGDAGLVRRVDRGAAGRAQGDMAVAGRREQAALDDPERRLVVAVGDRALARERAADAEGEIGRASC